MNPPDPAAIVEAVEIKLPMFDSIDPESWFIQCEVQFGNKNVKTYQTM